MAIRRRYFAPVAVAALVLLIGSVWWLRQDTEPIVRLLRQAESALKAKDFETAERLSRRILARRPNSKQALLLAGRAVAEQGRSSEAVEFLERIPDDRSPQALAARGYAGGLLIRKIKRLYDAEQQFRRAYRLDPNDLTANDQLSYLMHLGTRPWEAAPFDVALLRLIAVRPQRINHLYQMSFSDKVHGNADFVRECYEAHPDDRGNAVAYANIALFRQEYEEAEQILRTVVDAHPDYPDGQLKLGELLLEVGSDDVFHNWHAALPADADTHPGIWEIRGSWAQRHEQTETAARCFWEAVRLDPNLQQANYQLGRQLVALGRADEAEMFLTRSRLLLAYINAVQAAVSRSAQTTGNVKKPLEAAQAAEQTGLLWESSAWLRWTLRIAPTNGQAKQGLERVIKKLRQSSSQLTRAVAEVNPARRIDLSAYPLPDWNKGNDGPGRSGDVVPTTAQITFEDRAKQAGIDFTYDNGSDPQIRGLERVYEFTGGGVAVLDYDLDGWPDIYLTQGCSKPLIEDENRSFDRLYRNLGNGRFEDVTKAAGLVEDRYSQGAATGDFNSDGFVDLFVANFGRNRLYRNNGDGTFTDVSLSAELDSDFWTTSCLLADLNGDALPDIYEVNYLSGPDVVSRVCRDRTGRRNSCFPLEFPAAQDQLYLNLGDGRFLNVTEQSGIVAPAGKGLGIVAGDFDGSGKINLFVANDGEPNFYFANKTASPGARPAFDEQALPVGLALNADGWHEACMGVAAGDIDGNGLLDLFVTNFAEESNTLYRQQPGSLFLDATGQAGLRGPSMRLLGFGTQCLDGQLNGNLDLIVTNGHIDATDDPDLDYEMPPQFFHNTGEGRFSELPAEVLGPFFEKKYLGRGMARIDWNRDGRDDVVISHLDAPVALLTNTTEKTGHFLAIRLKGVTSNRDAIGATVTVTSGERKLVRQMTAGDGYQASNQRLLIFGLGENTHVETLEIRWPLGSRQTFSKLAADREVLFIEGRTEPVVFRIVFRPGGP